MRPSIRLIASATLVLVAQGVFAFNALGSACPGAPIESVMRTIPVYGIPTYTWPEYRRAEMFAEAACGYTY